MGELDAQLLLTAIEECSLSLVDCLQRQDPTYLEHLERRGELIRRLSSIALPIGQHATSVRLERCRLLGRQARAAAQRMYNSASSDLIATTQQLRVADGLRTLGRAQNAMLDVKA